MKKFLTIVISIFLLQGCLKQKEIEIPSDVIPYQDMVQIMADVQQAEVLLMFLRTKNLDSMPLPESLYKDIIIKRNITTDDFDKSFYFYASETKLMEILYSDVIEELTKRQAELEVN